MTLNALCLCMSHEKNVKVGKWSLQLLGKTGRPRQGVFEVDARKKTSFETLSSLEVCSFTWQVLDPGRRRKSLWGGSGRTSDIKMLPNQICRATCCCDPLWIREQLKVAFTKSAFFNMPWLIPLSLYRCHKSCSWEAWNAGWKDEWNCMTISLRSGREGFFELLRKKGVHFNLID